MARISRCVLGIYISVLSVVTAADAQQAFEAPVAGAFAAVKDEQKPSMSSEDMVLFEDRVWEPLIGSGDKAMEQKKFDVAEDDYVSALKAAYELGPGPYFSALALQRLEQLHQKTGDMRKLEKVYSRLIPIYQDEIFAPDGGRRAKAVPDLSEALERLAGVEVRLSNFAEAEEAYKSALEVEQIALAKAAAPERAPIENAIAHNRFLTARFYKDQGRFAEAEPLYREVMKSYTATYGADHFRVAIIERDAAPVLRANGKTDEANQIEVHADRILGAAGFPIPKN